MSEAKSVAIQRLGYYVSKVVMGLKNPSGTTTSVLRRAEHPDAQATGGDPIGGRGRMFMFWNLKEVRRRERLVALSPGPPPRRWSGTRSNRR